MRELGAFVRTTLADGSCSLPTYLASDVEPRDVQSATAFADGFLHSCSAEERARAGAVHVANGSLAELLLPIV